MSEHPIVDSLLETLSPSQRGAFEHIKDNKHDIALIQGPPGTGKTTFIVTLLQILCHLGHAWIACAPSNSATDHLATVFQQKCPELGAIRFHLYDNKARAFRRQERDSDAHNETEKSNEDQVDDKSDHEAEAAELTQVSTEVLEQRLFHAYIADLEKDDYRVERKAGST